MRVIKIGSREFLHISEFVIPVDRINEIDFHHVNGFSCRIKAGEMTYAFKAETTEKLSNWLSERRAVR